MIFRYKYSKDDEEIYKEFMEINNELIPHILKADGEYQVLNIAHACKGPADNNSLRRGGGKKTVLIKT